MPEWIAVISDTHGMLRPEAREALRGCAHIVHAGDIGSEPVLAELHRLAPLTAVRGNVDCGPWADALPEWRSFECLGLRLHLLHDLDRLDLDPRAEGIDVVICGHSHRPRVEWRGPVLYLNPGSAGPRRSRLPVTMACLRAAGGSPEAERIDLFQRRPPP